jgi:hypothetical protein
MGGVDTGFNHLVRPSVQRYHHIVNASRGTNGSRTSWDQPSRR